MAKLIFQGSEAFRVFGKTRGPRISQMTADLLIRVHLLNLRPWLFRFRSVIWQG